MRKPCRILVVEDNDLVHELLEAVCVEEGFEVVRARNSFEARDQIDLEGFDVVIIDITLPGSEDGFALAERAAKTSVGIILMSGNPAHFERAQASAHAFLKK